MMSYFVQNYQGELSHDFAMFHASLVIFKSLLKYIIIVMLLNMTIFYIRHRTKEKCSQQQNKLSRSRTIISLNRFSKSNTL